MLMSVPWEPTIVTSTQTASTTLATTTASVERDTWVTDSSATHVSNEIIRSHKNKFMVFGNHAS